MRSGELAGLCGISTDTLRHYERVGLLPRPKRTAGNYREYPPEARARVELIQRALTIGFSLRELKPILAQRERGGAPCRDVREGLRRKIRQLGEQIKQMEEARAELRRIGKEWDRRLDWAKAGHAARLLETVSPRVKRTAGFKRKNQGKEQ